MTFRRLSAGVYESADGRYRILRIDHDRPHSGVYYLWEGARWDRGGWTVDSGLALATTLREAKRQMQKHTNTESVP